MTIGGLYRAYYIIICLIVGLISNLQLCVELHVVELIQTYMGHDVRAYGHQLSFNSVSVIFHPLWFLSVNFSEAGVGP